MTCSGVLTSAMPLSLRMHPLLIFLDPDVLGRHASPTNFSLEEPPQLQSGQALPSLSGHMHILKEDFLFTAIRHLALGCTRSGLRGNRRDFAGKRSEQFALARIWAFISLTLQILVAIQYFPVWCTLSRS